MHDGTVTEAGMRIVRLLAGRPPKTVDELVDAVGVTRTAVAEQLRELTAAGFVEKTCKRLPGRGRPQHLYSATSHALLLLFKSNQQLLVPAVWEAIAEVGGSQLKRKVLKRVSRKMAGHYSRRIKAKTPAKRLCQMARLLREEGDLVEIERGKNGEWVIRRRTCAFYSMFEETRTVCCLDEEILRLVVGEKLRRTMCRHDGDPCCAFALDRGDNGAG